MKIALTVALLALAGIFSGESFAQENNEAFFRNSAQQQKKSFSRIYTFVHDDMENQGEEVSVEWTRRKSISIASALLFDRNFRDNPALFLQKALAKRGNHQQSIVTVDSVLAFLIELKRRGELVGYAQLLSQEGIPVDPKVDFLSGW